MRFKVENYYDSTYPVVDGLEVVITDYINSDGDDENHYDYYLEINTLEELIQLQKKLGHYLVIGDYGGVNEILIDKDDQL